MRNKILTFIVLLGLLTTPLFAIDVSINDTTVVEGDTVKIPIVVKNLIETDIYSYQFELDYNSKVLSTINVSNEGTICSDWEGLIVNDQTDGKIFIGNYGANSITENGVLVYIEFHVTAAPPDTGTLVLNNFMFNSGDPAVNVSGGVIIVTEELVPVELFSFISEVDKNNVNLIWITQSEKDNFGFQIERSSDNQSYTKIGFIKGSGTTHIRNSYQFQDENLSEGTYYYRIKQIDFDGRSEYSDVRIVAVTKSLDYILSQNYPNPFNPETMICFEVPTTCTADLSVYNLKGQLIKNLMHKKVLAGNYSIHWDATDQNGHQVPTGVYLYQIKTGQFSQIKKMTLMK